VNLPADQAEALAKRRFMAINLIRITGLACVLLGIAITQGVIDLPRFVGVVLAIFGLYDFFFMPRIIAKRWRSGDK